MSIYVMTRDLPDNALESWLFEGIESFVHDGVFLPSHLANARSSPSSSQHYAAQNYCSPSQHYDPYEQHSWNPDVYHPGIAYMPVPNHHESVTSSVYDNNPPYECGQASTSSIALEYLNRSFSASDPVEYLSPPVVDASYKESSEGTLTETLKPRSFCDGPSHK